MTNKKRTSSVHIHFTQNVFARHTDRPARPRAHADVRGRSRAHAHTAPLASDVCGNMLKHAFDLEISVPTRCNVMKHKFNLELLTSFIVSCSSDLQILIHSTYSRVANTFPVALIQYVLGLFQFSQHGHALLDVVVVVNLPCQGPPNCLPKLKHSVSEVGVILLVEPRHVSLVVHNNLGERLMDEKLVVLSQKNFALEGLKKVWKSRHDDLYLKNQRGRSSKRVVCLRKNRLP